MSDAAAVLTEVREGVGIATLNRSEKFNCISSELVAGLAGALAAFEDDPAVRVFLLAANGKHFCTGADLVEVTEARKSRRALARYISALHAVLNDLEASPLPVVAAVNGLALAGGLEIVLACDVVFAADSARIGDQHAQYGLIPGGGGSQRLPRLVGLRRALELMYSARWLDAEEAHAWGLVNHVVPAERLHEAAFSFCRELGARNPQGIAAMKQLARTGLALSPADGLRHEAEAVVDALLGENVSEGLAAFKERRPPRFR
jgi:enoyl-CoA hydratase/carnithine racemase